MQLADAVYLVYEAKRMAENSHFVGKETDLAVIVPGQDAHFLRPEALSQLAAIYESKEPPDLTPAEIDAINALLPAAPQ